MNLIACAAMVLHDSHRCQDEKLKAIAQQAIQETRQKRATYNRITKSAPGTANREIPRFALWNRRRRSLVI